MSESHFISKIKIEVDGIRSERTVDNIVNFSYVNDIGKNQTNNYKELADFEHGHFTVSPVIPAILLYTTDKNIITKDGHDYEHAVQNVICFVKENNLYSLEQVNVQFGTDHPLSRVMAYKKETHIILEDTFSYNTVVNIPGRVADDVTEIRVIKGFDEEYDIIKTIAVKGMRIAAHPERKSWYPFIQ